MWTQYQHPCLKISNLKTLRHKPKIQKCHMPRWSDPSCMWQYRHDRYIIHGTTSKSIHDKLTQEHWTTVKHVLWYLKGTCDKGITYSWAGNTPPLKIYSDANFANRTDAKSISGYACIIDGACIVWSPKKQGTVALSTTKVEYIVLTHAAKQMTWIRHLLDKIGLEQRDSTPIHCNNLSTITITQHNISCTDKTHQNLISFYPRKSGFKRSITHSCHIKGQCCRYYDKGHPSWQSH